MGTMYHEYVAGPGDRCVHKMRTTGLPCLHPIGSHKKDLREGDRHLEKVDRHKGPRVRKIASRPKKSRLPTTFVFWDDEGKNVEIDCWHDDRQSPDGNVPKCEVCLARCPVRCTGSCAKCTAICAVVCKRCNASCGEPCIEHRLIYGAAVDQSGKVICEVESVNEARQPPTEVWLDGILKACELSGQRSLYSYGFGYDRTKMLEGVDPRILYLLNHREKRETRERPGGKGTYTVPLYWRDYQLDLQGSKFSIAKLKRQADGRPERYPDKVIKGKKIRGKRKYQHGCVWDILKFFQCPFVEALETWRKKWVCKGKDHRPFPIPCPLCEGGTVPGCGLCSATGTISLTLRSHDTEEQAQSCCGKGAGGENLTSELIVPTADLELMRIMKAKRADFDKMPWEQVKTYCQSECKHGANLVKELVTACDNIGVRLRRFDGAGSISDALMRNHEVNEFMTDRSIDRWMTDGVLRAQLNRAVMIAFAGGRFEAPYCGILRGEVWAKDIASAYPYAMYLHPCLACGKWEHIPGGTRKIDIRIERADLALVRVRSWGRDKNQALGSFHHRCSKKFITFPIENQTWVWKPEYIAGRDAMKDRIEILEAFVYHTDCVHHPFRFMGELYLERLRIGKEGKGIAMKLGYNGCAGKTMQHIGSHKWQEYIWAGNTTSRTRAQLLHAIGRFRNQWDVCYIATDSVFALSDVPFPLPEDTGTLGASEWGKPPLGGWEPAKDTYKGICIVRPGVAFPLQATSDQLKEIKARGISKNVLLDHSADVVKLMSSQERVGDAGDKLQFKRRLFAGMKMSVSRRGKNGDYTYHAADNYGQWYEQPIQIKLSAQPKRFKRLPGEDGMLLPWARKEGESLPYVGGDKSEEGEALAEMQERLEEQPDLALTED